MTARRLLLSTPALALLRERVLPPPLALPPGFAPDPPADAVAGAVAELLETGAAAGDASLWSAHPAVAGDLRVLAVPEVAVLVRAARPGLEVSAAIAVSGPRGAGLSRTGGAVVQLSCFRATSLAAELARVVPAPDAAHRPGRAQELPLDQLAGGASVRGHGTLRATVLAAPRPDRPAGVVGSVHWAWDGSGWVGVRPLPARDGRPWVRLEPAGPADLAPWVAPLVAAAAA